MLIFTINYNAIPLRTVCSQFFTFLLLSSHLLHAAVCIVKSFLCHDMKQSMYVPFTGPPALTMNIVRNIETSSVVVLWDEVDDSLPTTYVVTWTSDVTNSIQSHTLIEQSSYTITGLTLDTIYTITVTASDRCGTGPNSTASVTISTGITYIHTFIIYVCILYTYC